jgi:hypothetical protein
MGVEGEAVDYGRDQSWVGKHRAPFAEGEVVCQPDAGVFLALGDDFEQQFGSAVVDLDVA